MNDQLQKQLGALASLLMVIVSIFFVVKSGATLYGLQNPVPYEHSITVNGIGKAKVTPDLAVITFGIRSDADTNEKAQTLNSETTNALVASIKQTGIEEKDIKTLNYNLMQNRVWNPDKNQDELKGWIVTQSVEVRVHDKANISPILKLGSAKGVTDVNGPNFQLDDTSTYKDAARTEAIADAQKQAEQLAKELGLHLGAVSAYSEYDNGVVYPMYSAMDSTKGMMAGAANAPSPEVQPGQTEVDLNVSITYILK